MNTTYVLISITLMALVTYLPRMLPIAIFRKKIKSRFVQSFLKYVPYAVLGALTIPDIFYSTGEFISALCGTVVALILAYFERGLVVVAIGGVLAVYLTGLLI